MASTLTQKAQHKQTQESQIDCSCECLDTSLSKVGDSECSCSQCLEANLQAFNELKALQEQRASELDNKHTRGASTRVTTRQQQRPASRNAQDKKTQSRLNSYKSADKCKPFQSTVRNKENNEDGAVQTNVEYFGQQAQSKFSRQCINDYIKITQHRARQYLNQRKKLEKNEERQRQQLKQMVKENLRALKFTIEHQKNQNNEKQKQGKGEFEPRHRWNHEPYHCKSRVQCKGKPLPYDPDLENKQEQIAKIKKRIQEYEEKTKQKPYECPDQCPRHHMRTSKKKLAQIQKFIKNKAKAYEQQKKKQKAEKQQKEKIKAAKLRAIDIRCKNLVAKSKKYDPDISRTSFHNSIDHFSTFSELRIFKQEKMEQRQKKMKVRKAMKQGGAIQEQMYQDLSDELIGDPPIHSKIGKQNQSLPYEEETEQWCEKIVKDARIRPPKELKKEDAERKTSKKVQVEKKKPVEQKKSKKETEKMLKKEEQKRRQLQMEIQRRKEQIFNEYQKRNSGAKASKDLPNNKQLRQDYQQTLKSQKSPSSRQGANRKQESYDPYRQNYKHQASTDKRQLDVVGDPLMQQFEYQRNVGRIKELQIDEDHEVFTKSGTALKNKPFLKI